MQKAFFISMIITAASKTFAQIPATGTWFALQLPVKISDKWQWHNDAGYRTLGASFNAYQFLYRTGIRHVVNKKWSVATGAAVFYTRSSYQKYNHEFGGEFRLWQELNAQHPVSKSISFQNRIRTEQRWFAVTDSRDAYFGFRIRYRAAATKELSEKWSIQLANEYMRQQANNKFLFNQNRLIATALYKLSSSAQIQGGYMLLKWTSSSQHIITFTLQKIISLHGIKRNG